jgi:hypothetical protein
MADMSQPVDDRAFMINILSSLGDAYEMVKFHLDHRMFSTSHPLTIEELHHELNNHFNKTKFQYNPVTGNQTTRPQGQDRVLYQKKIVLVLQGHVPTATELVIVTCNALVKLGMNMMLQMLLFQEEQLKQLKNLNHQLGKQYVLD